MKIVVAQHNPTVGDLQANLHRLKRSLDVASQAGADLVVGTELNLCGYPPKDLLHRGAWLQRMAQSAQELVAQSVQWPSITMLLGTPIAADGALFDLRCGAIANGAIAIRNGEIVAAYKKQCLPEYDIFDEQRYFIADPSQAPCILTLPQWQASSGEPLRIAISICEDAWVEAKNMPAGVQTPIDKAAQAGADLIVNLSASPFEHGKPARRAAIMARACLQARMPMVYANQVGGQDALLFDGHSLLIDAQGRCHKQGPSFAPSDEVWDLQPVLLQQGQKTAAASAPAVLPSPLKSPSKMPAGGDMHTTLLALKMGLQDYCRRAGLSRVVLGISGGIDSAVVAALAAYALGPDAVLGLSMPSQYSSQGSIHDAKALAQALGFKLQHLDIQTAHTTLAQTLSPALGDMPAGLTDENLQARIRGVLVMAMANQHHALALVTSNKSEAAVGYGTLYGDMAGGLAPVADLYKTEIYALGRALNACQKSQIPEAIFDKEPSAELRPNQCDTDSLPDYAVLDEMLFYHIEGGEDHDQLLARGFDPKCIADVLGRVHRSEHKRHQSPPVLRVSTCAFGAGRRIPLSSAPFEPKAP